MFEFDGDNDSNTYEISVWYFTSITTNDVNGNDITEPEKIRILIKPPPGYNDPAHVLTPEGAVKPDFNATANTGSIYINAYTDTPLITGSTHTEITSETVRPGLTPKRT